MAKAILRTTGLLNYHSDAFLTNFVTSLGNCIYFLTQTAGFHGLRLGPGLISCANH